MKKGFTLIELLVVISVIGTLASVILVALQSARQKASTGAAQVFEGTNYHALGATGLADWDFEDTNNLGADNSGNNNPLILTGNTINTPVPGITGNALQFDGSTDFAQSTNQITYPKDWTISIWIYPRTNLDTQAFAAIIDTDHGLPPNNNNINMNMQLGKLQFYWRCLVGIRCTTNAGIGTGAVGGSAVTIKVNTWNQVSVTHNNIGSGLTTLYLNGIAIGVNDSADSIIYDSRILLGQFYGQPGVKMFGGYIDDVRIYPQALSSADVEHMYAEGLPTHLLIAKK